MFELRVCAFFKVALGFGTPYFAPGRVFIVLDIISQLNGLKSAIRMACRTRTGNLQHNSTKVPGSSEQLASPQMTAWIDRPLAQKSRIIG